LPCDTPAEDISQELTALGLMLQAFGKWRPAAPYLRATPNL
jgi:hypothetical protein